MKELLIDLLDIATRLVLDDPAQEAVFFAEQMYESQQLFLHFPLIFFREQQFTKSAAGSTSQSDNP